MNNRPLFALCGLSLICALAFGPHTILGARAGVAPTTRAPRYSVTDLGDKPRDFDINRLRVRTPRQWPKMGVLKGYQITVPKDINLQGQVAGSEVFPSGDAYLVERDHAFMWDHGALHDLGGLPGDKVSHAVAINNNGEIVGDSCKANFPPGRYASHAVLWSKAGMRDIAKGFAVGINDAGAVIGYSAGVGRVSAFYTHAWVSRGGNRPTDLGSLGGFTTEPHSINYAGWGIRRRRSCCERRWGKKGLRTRR